METDSVIGTGDGLANTSKEASTGVVDKDEGHYYRLFRLLFIYYFILDLLLIFIIDLEKQEVSKDAEEKGKDVDAALNLGPSPPFCFTS
jgi:hypothetical protein